MAKTKSEHAIVLIKAGISAVPVVGEAVASLIGDYVPTATQKSIDHAMVLLRDRLTELEDRLDVEAVNKDDFSELFKSCFLSIVRTHRESKLKAATSILANLLLKDGDSEKLSYTELDHFSRCVESLSSGAVEVLGVVMSAARENTRIDPLSETFRLDFSYLNERFSESISILVNGISGRTRCR